MKCAICEKETNNELCNNCSEELKKEGENIQKEEYDYIVNNSLIGLYQRYKNNNV